MNWRLYWLYALDEQGRTYRRSEFLNKKKNNELIYLLALLSVPNVANTKTTKKKIELMLIQDSTNRDILVKLILRHKIVHCAFDNITSLQNSKHEEIAKLLSKYKAISTLRQTVLYEQFCLIRDIFKKNSIAYRAIKGFTLSERLYPSKFSRDIRDIDIWIPRAKLHNAHQALLNLNGKLLKPNSIDYYSKIEVRYKDLYYKMGQRNLLELHMRLLPVKTKFSCHLDNVLDTRDLSPEEEFIYLCVHGVISGYYRLRWLTDLYLIIEEGNLDEAKVMTLAKDQNVLKHVVTSIRLIESIYSKNLTKSKAFCSELDAFDRGLVKLAVSMCCSILCNTSPKNKYRETVKYYFLSLICTKGSADMKQFIKFLFGPSWDEAKEKDTFRIFRRITGLLKRGIKYLKG